MYIFTRTGFKAGELSDTKQLSVVQAHGLTEQNNFGANVRKVAQLLRHLVDFRFLNRTPY